MVRSMVFLAAVATTAILMVSGAGLAQIPDPPESRDPPVPNPQEPIPDPQECNEFFPLFDFAMCKAGWGEQAIEEGGQWSEDQILALGSWLMLASLDWQTYLGCEIVGGPVCIELNCGEHTTVIGYANQLIAEPFCEEDPQTVGLLPESLNCGGHTDPEGWANQMIADPFCDN